MTKAVMLDFETLATSVDAMLVSIGAVAFDPYAEKFEITQKYYQLFDFDTPGNEGMISGKTLGWWMRQSEEARSVFWQAENKDYLHRVFLMFGDFIREYGGDEIWSKGANFDIAIAEFRYNQHSIPIPWKYDTVRCFRTLIALNPGKEPGLQTSKHNALADAEHQAKWCHAILGKSLGGVSS